MFQNRPWIFQQDSTPAHKAKTMKQWVKNHVPEFINSDHWLSASPDLNPIDYTLSSVLEGWSVQDHNLESLKQMLVAAVDNFPMDVDRTAIDEWPNRLWHCITANSGYF